MNALIDLATKIAEYNLIGAKKLPSFKLAIIQNPTHKPIVDTIIS